MQAENFTVLTPLDFIKDVEQEAKKAKYRVWAQAMEVESGEVTETFLQVFRMAAKRGIDTRLHADYYSLLFTDGIFNYWPFVSSAFRRKRHQRLKKQQALAASFKEAGIQFLYTNPPSILDRLFPARGRNHMKIVLIDMIAWIGGVNFHDDNFAIQDVMVKITDPAISMEIAYVYERIDRRESLRDMAIQCTDETTLLIDSGMINRSIILRHAVDLVKNAEKKIQVISPLIPDADLLRALNTAKKQGREVDIIAPKAGEMSGIYQLVDEFNDFVMKFRHLTLPIQFKDFMLHAKILIVDEREIIVGSHNFSSRGVRMGTEEIALQSTNKVLVQNILRYAKNLSEIDKTPA